MVILEKTKQMRKKQKPKRAFNEKTRRKNNKTK
jgi:hypothetical protein